MRRSSISEEVFDENCTILYDDESEETFVLNKNASIIWRLIENTSYENILKDYLSMIKEQSASNEIKEKGFDQIISYLEEKKLILRLDKI